MGRWTTKQCVHSMASPTLSAIYNTRFNGTPRKPRSSSTTRCCTHWQCPSGGFVLRPFGLWAFCVIDARRVEAAHAKLPFPLVRRRHFLLAGLCQSKKGRNWPIARILLVRVFAVYWPEKEKDKQWGWSGICWPINKRKAKLARHKRGMFRN